MWFSFFFIVTRNHTQWKLFEGANLNQNKALISHLFYSSQFADGMNNFPISLIAPWHCQIASAFLCQAQPHIMLDSRESNQWGGAIQQQIFTQFSLLKTWILDLKSFSKQNKKILSRFDFICSIQFYVFSFT